MTDQEMVPSGEPPLRRNVPLRTAVRGKVLSALRNQFDAALKTIDDATLISIHCDTRQDLDKTAFLLFAAFHTANYFKIHDESEVPIANLFITALSVIAETYNASP